MVPDSHRVVNYKDAVPDLPRAQWFNTVIYAHVGTVFSVDANAEVDAQGNVIRKPESMGHWLFRFLPQTYQDLLSGESVAQHLTPNYFKAISKASGSSRQTMNQLPK